MAAVGYAPTVVSTVGASSVTSGSVPAGISAGRRNFLAMMPPAPKMVYLCPSPLCGEVATGAG